MSRAAALLVLGAIFVAGCKKEAPPPPPNDPAAAMKIASEKMAEASKQMAAAGNSAEGAQGMAAAMQAMGTAMAGGQKVEPVSFRDLKTLLPESLPGFTRKTAKGEKNGAMGISFSQATADYDGPSGADLDIKIIDVGTLSGPLAMGMAGWASLEVDKETETGYEKTTTFGKHKGLEKYDSARKSGEVKAIVAGRFIVEVRGHNVSAADLKGALAKVDLGKLEGMKSQGM
jgi:hypothetical protein